MGEMPALSRKMTMLRYTDIRLYAAVPCLVLGDRQRARPVRAYGIRESYSLMWEETQIPMTMEEMYLTDHFVISASYPFEAVPYTRLRQAEYSSGMVIGVTEDGFAHILAAGPRSRPYGAMLAGEINRRMEMCGCPGEPASEYREKIIE